MVDTPLRFILAVSIPALAATSAGNFDVFAGWGSGFVEAAILFATCYAIDIPAQLFHPPTPVAARMATAAAGALLYTAGFLYGSRQMYALVLAAGAVWVATYWMSMGQPLRVERLTSEWRARCEAALQRQSQKPKTEERLSPLLVSMATLFAASCVPFVGLLTFGIISGALGRITPLGGWILLASVFLAVLWEAKKRGAGLSLNWWSKSARREFREGVSAQVFSARSPLAFMLTNVGFLLVLVLCVYLDGTLFLWRNAGLWTWAEYGLAASLDWLLFLPIGVLYCILASLWTFDRLLGRLAFGRPMLNPALHFIALFFASIIMVLCGWERWTVGRIFGTPHSQVLAPIYAEFLQPLRGRYMDWWFEAGKPIPFWMLSNMLVLACVVVAILILWRVAPKKTASPSPDSHWGWALSGLLMFTVTGALSLADAFGPIFAELLFLGLAVPILLSSIVQMLVNSLEGSSPPLEARNMAGFAAVLCSFGAHLAWIGALFEGVSLMAAAVLVPALFLWEKSRLRRKQAPALTRN